jgi:hypothetical protein
MDSMKIFRGIPMFHGECSRMPAIEFAIQILVVLLLGAGAVIGETTEKNETLIASLNVTETTSCKNLNYF